MNGIQCYDCGKFIAFKDFDDGRVGWVKELFLGDFLDPPELVPICPKCVEKANNVEKYYSMDYEAVPD